ncbi:MAG: membrane protein insertion efficiency factor YidD [Myxococcales bacterium]|nr:membrane protein insertion efficiency factor YidD [Myxococcales bacterium]
MSPLPRLLGCLALIGAASLPAAGGEFGPWSADERHPVTREAEASAGPRTVPPGAPRAEDELFLGLMFRFWVDGLSRADGDRCAHQPSCSAYARKVMLRHSFPVSGWMALARLWRGARSSALRELPLVLVDGALRLLDRVEDGKFWAAGYLPLSGR